MPNLDYTFMETYPLQYIRLDPTSVLPNVLRHVSAESLGERHFNAVVGSAEEVPTRGSVILNMLAAMLEGKNRGDVAHLFRDETDALCWNALAMQLPGVSRQVQVIALNGAGPYASPEAMSFCSDVLMMAKFGVPRPSESQGDVSSVWARAFRAELALESGSVWPNPSAGYVGLYADQMISGAWKTAVVYSSDDYRNPAVKANHYWARSSEIMNALLLSDNHGGYWAYITRDWEIPDGGNMMRVYPVNASHLISLGMEPYPMLHENPYAGYIKWDKSDVLETNPVPAMLEDSIEEIANLLGLIDRSGWITSASQWVELVGNTISDLDAGPPESHRNHGSTESTMDMVFAGIQNGHPNWTISASAYRRIESRWRDWLPRMSSDWDDSPQHVQEAHISATIMDDAIWQVWLKSDWPGWDDPSELDTNGKMRIVADCVMHGQWWRNHAKANRWGFDEWSWQKRWAFERIAVRECINKSVFAPTTKEGISASRQSVVEKMWNWHTDFDQQHPNGVAPTNIPSFYFNLEVDLI